MSTTPSQQYRMLLNALEQAGHAKFEVTVEVSGPPQRPRWRAVVTVLDVSPRLSALVPVGTARQADEGTKAAAKDVACKQMLDLFASHGLRPTGGY